MLSLTSNSVISRLTRKFATTVRVTNAFGLTRTSNQGKKVERLTKKTVEDKRKAEEKKAFKPFKKLNSYTIFVKEVNRGDLKECSRAWRSLSDQDRAIYEEKTRVYNTEMAKKFPEKPKRPQSGYLSFSVQNKHLYPSDAPFGERGLFFAKKWNQLTEAEKERFTPSPSAWDEYKEKVRDWEALRWEQYTNRVKK